MFDRYSIPARRTIFFARFEAGALGSPSIGTEHLLLGILKVDQGGSVIIIPGGEDGRPPLIFPEPERKAFTAEEAEDIRKRVERFVPRKKGIPSNVDMPLDEAARRVLADALKVARLFGHEMVEPLHLLRAVVDARGSLGERVLAEAGVSAEQIDQAIGSAGYQ